MPSARALHPVSLFRSKPDQRTHEDDVRPLVLKKSLPARIARDGLLDEHCQILQSPECLVAERRPQAAELAVHDLRATAWTASGQVPAALASQRLRKRSEGAITKLLRLEERAFEIVAAVDDRPEVCRRVLPFVLSRLGTRATRDARMRLHRLRQRPVVGSARCRDRDVVPVLGQRQHDTVEMPQDVRARELK